MTRSLRSVHQLRSTCTRALEEEPEVLSPVAAARLIGKFGIVVAVFLRKLHYPKKGVPYNSDMHKQLDQVFLSGRLERNRGFLFVDKGLTAMVISVI